MSAITSEETSDVNLLLVIVTILFEKIMDMLPDFVTLVMEGNPIILIELMLSTEILLKKLLKVLLLVRLSRMKTSRIS